MNRDQILEILGLEKQLDDETGKKYMKGSGPINQEEAEDIKKLLSFFTESQEKIIRVLSEKDLTNDKETRKSIAGLGFHESYHLGQIGLLRKLLGKRSKVG
ncbi:MAG: hypothetical protein IPM38_02565 [Ignavibacteria bacterium]|nr:hypothetical protein [Ignavibacteria bacterium]